MAESHPITRRTFLHQTSATAIAGLSAAAFGPWIAHGAAGGSKPNILVIMSDEHDPRVSGCYGDKVVHTPHMDSIAERGIVFENCYTTSPLCVPARLSFTAGKYASRIGAWNNSCMLPSDDYPSVPHILNAAGYESFLAGKMHYDATHRYGFRELYPSNNAFMDGRGGRRKADDETVNEAAWNQRVAGFKIADTSSVIAHDVKVTENVVKFLSERRPGDKPFFLLAGYLAPHFPLTVPQKYYAPYKDKIPMPEIPEGFFDRMPLNYKHLRRGFGTVCATPEQVKLGRELYYGLTHWLDDEIGKVLAALGKSAAAQNTVIIYTADHGENRGERGLWWKNCMYETAARIPLIVSWPERWKGGQRRAGACSTVDIARTIAEIAGARIPDDWNGDSLAPYADDPARAWKDLAVSEYYAHNIASGYAMIRTGQYKYVYHTRMDEQHGPERELYDLNADPNEFNNLAGQKAHSERVAALHQRLVKELGRDPDETEQICRADYAKGYAREKGKPKAAKKQKAKAKKAA
ncbi:MAG: sulfatase-like hydrolase/transferase [Candidatus Sumerlaeia bacterium]|nr:sulfatase-like hydrolase/transferase [Candidatus Sumerlaeia bacterium]